LDTSLLIIFVNPKREIARFSWNYEPLISLIKSKTLEVDEETQTQSWVWV
jgi:hypothetical protein